MLVAQLLSAPQLQDWQSVASKAGLMLMDCFTRQVNVRLLRKQHGLQCWSFSVLLMQGECV